MAEKTSKNTAGGRGRDVIPRNRNKKMRKLDKRSKVRSYVQMEKEFLAHYKRYGVITHAARHANTSVSAIYTYMHNFPDFKEQVDLAYEEFRGSLEIEAQRRAVEGVEKSIYFKGEVVGKEREYSDTLLQFMMKRHIAEYREKSAVDMNVGGGVVVIPDSPKTPEEIAKWLEMASNVKLPEATRE